MAMLFASEMHASQCKRYLKQHTRNTLRAITYTVSLASSTVGALEQHRIQWEHAELHAILYPPDLDPLAKGFWQHTGYGISSRYAKFCMEKVDDLRLQSPSRPKDPVNFDVVEGSSSQQAEDEKSKTVLRRRIAELASNSDIALKEKDVHIFSCGMSAISTVAQALQAIGGSETSPNVVVAYG